MSFKWTNEGQDLLPGDENKDGNLPPMSPEWFDGEKESTKLKFPKCKHKLQLVSAIEAKCTLCGSGWQGMGIVDLVKASQLKSPRRK